MKAVWSFWSKPMQDNTSWSWLSQKHHLLSWILSVKTAEKQFSELSLYTDEIGADLLTRKIGLNFSHISCNLNDLHKYDSDWWVLGKLYTYREQKEPFIHIDNDAFIWNNLPDKMLNASILAQNPDYFIVGESKYYRPDIFENIINCSTNGWLPEEWLWSRRIFGNYQVGVGCGIFGGNNIDFINYYSDLAIKLIMHDGNIDAFSKIENKKDFSILIEQYLLSACIDFNNHSSRNFDNLTVEYLFNFFEDCFFNAKKVGYTHLVGSAKKNRLICKKLENRVQKDFPDLYNNCIKYFSDKEIT